MEVISSDQLPPNGRHKERMIVMDYSRPMAQRTFGISLHYIICIVSSRVCKIETCFLRDIDIIMQTSLAGACFKITYKNWNRLISHSIILYYGSTRIARRYNNSLRF